MYTPNELRDMSFNKALIGGYDMGEVDRAMSSISEDYATLFKENTMLKKKLKLLADTVEDYRSVDEAMRKALITAQNMANEMVEEAEKKSRDMLEIATNEAKAKISSLTASVAAEEARLAKAKAQTADFIDSITKIFDVEREKFLTLKAEVAPSIPEPAAEEPISDTLEQIAKSLDEKLMEENERMASSASEEKIPEVVPVSEEKEVKEPSSDTISFENSIPTVDEMDKLEAEAAAKVPRRNRPVFENLRFGSDYDISEEK